MTQRRNRSKSDAAEENHLDTAASVERLLLGVGCLYLLGYLTIAVLRLNYPFELEWMEGAVVDQVSRILHGQLLYVHPSIDFVPAIYTPLYYYVSAIVTLVTGPGFLPLRLVSLLASMGAFGVIYQLVRRETGSYQSGLLAACLFAATYRVCGAWFDIARADSLFLLLLLLGLYWLRFSETRRTLLLSAIALWASLLTKQSALVITAPLLLYAVIAYKRKAMWFVLTFLALVGGTVWLMDRIHDGWFSFYVFELPARHQIDSSQYLGFWINGILKHVAIAAGISIAVMLRLWREGRRQQFLFNAALLAGCLAASWSSLLHSGGYDNVLMPAMMAVMVTSSARRTSGTASVENSPRAHRNGARPVAISLLFLIQFVMLIYNPVNQIPTQSRMAAGAEIVRAISQFPGEVYMPFHGYLLTLAGKNPHAHKMAVTDVTRADTAMAREISAELDSAYVSRRFSLVILDGPSALLSLQQNYEMTNRMPGSVMDYWPMTGLPTRPRFWYVPRK